MALGRLFCPKFLDHSQDLHYFKEMDNSIIWQRWGNFFKLMDISIFIARQNISYALKTLTYLIILPHFCFTIDKQAWTGSWWTFPTLKFYELFYETRIHKYIVSREWKSPKHFLKKIHWNGIFKEHHFLKCSALTFSKINIIFAIGKSSVCLQVFIHDDILMKLLIYFRVLFCFSI